MATYCGLRYYPYRHSIEDQKIFQKAVLEKRFLITRDKYFKKLDPEGKTVIYLKSEDLNAWAKQLKDEWNVDWLFSPFSRCLKKTSA